MHPKLLDVIVCPTCRADLSLEATCANEAGQVETGTLRCTGCGTTTSIDRGIPRFVESHAADESFGFQWKHFRVEQLDSWNGAMISANRLWTETGWTPERLAGARVLEIGCGAGRFLEVVSRANCEVIGVDVSSAIDAAAATVKSRPNAHLVQADVYQLPFRDATFDAVYCIGVAQHTPFPLKTLQALPRLLKPGGQLAITVYERKPWTRLNGKYLLRPVVKHMSKQSLMKAIKWSMPILFPLTDVLFRLPLIGRAFDFAIPVANYVDLRELTREQRYRLALLDTFDRLAPQFDQPLSEDEVRAALVTEGLGNLRRLPNSGLNLVGSAESRRT